MQTPPPRRPQPTTPPPPSPPAASRWPDLDPRVLARARAGDPRATRWLVRRYGGLVAARIRRVVGPAGPGAADEALVEDLSQEAFLRAFRALDRYERRDDATLATWLATIATRVAIDALRRRRPEVLAGPVAHALEHAVDERERADEALARGELRRALDRAFAQLPPALAEVFRLSALEGRPCAAIAAAQGCPVGTVKSRLARARQRLRRALRAQGAGLPAR